MPALTARNTQRRPGRFEVQKPGISRFSSPALMISALKGKDRESVIGELAMRLETEGFVDKGAMLVESALRREALFSTAVDHGLAFPHVRGVEGGALTLAVGMSAKGVHFEGSKGPLSRLFFFMVIPTAASSFYLKLLAGLAETFMTAEAREAILECKTDADMWKALVKLTRKAIK
jgi:mannitol/fructose-specific phosphotransferase system IIA component (Ntr-type)